MVGKRDIKQRLSKGLTGMEVVRLIIEDSVEVDHQREGFLSSADIQRLKNSLVSQADTQDYNKWIRVYQLVDFSVKEASIHALKAEKDLLLAARELERYRLEDRIRSLLCFFVPAIVTQKQYDELKAKQKESSLRLLLTLRLVLSEVAEGLAPEDIKAKWQEGDETGSFEYLLDYLEDAKSELYGQIIQRGIQLIQEGKLRPVQLQAKAIQQLKKLEAEEKKQRAKEKDHPEEITEEPSVWSAFVKKQKQLTRASYETAKAGQSQDSLISYLEQLKSGSLPEKEAEKLLDYTYCLGEELSQLGLAGWIDKYNPGLDEETGARPAGMMQSQNVAIIQDPYPDDLDERGYYKDVGLELLSRLSGYRGRKSKTDSETSMPDSIKILHKDASEHIKMLLAIQAVVEAVSQILGVKLTEDLEERYSSIQDTVQYYNGLLTGRRNEYIGPPYYLGMPKLAGLKVGKLKATAKSVQYYRERMAMALGDEWWQEATKALDLQAEEEGSLAEKFTQELKAEKERRASDA